MSLYSIPTTDENAFRKMYIDTVRSSVQTWTDSIGANVQLTTAGTAQDLYLISRDDTTRNIITNPSMETGNPPTGYAAISSTLSQTAAFAQFGTNSLQCVTSNLVATEGWYWQLAVVPPPINQEIDPDGYSASVYLRGNVGGETLFIQYLQDGVVLFQSPLFTLTTSFVRYSLPIIRPSSQALTNARIRVVTNVQQAITFQADGFQFERYPTPTTYCDGAQGRFFFWEGAAHASTSIRAFRVVEVRGWDLFIDLDTYIDVDRTATTSSPFIKAGSNWSPSHPVEVNNRISFLNVNVGERPTIRGVLWVVHGTGNE